MTLKRKKAAVTSDGLKLTPKRTENRSAGATSKAESAQSVKLAVTTSSTPGESQLSFPFNGEVTGRSFGQSLMTFARSEVFPLEGRDAAYLLDQVKPIREALELMEERWRESLQANADAIPGWQLTPGAYVRELGQHTALHVWERLQDDDDCPLSLDDFLDCCRPGLTALENALAREDALEPHKARALLNRLLGDLLTARQNRSSLRQMNIVQAVAQAKRLEGATNEC